MVGAVYVHVLRTLARRVKFHFWFEGPFSRIASHIVFLNIKVLSDRFYRLSGGINVFNIRKNHLCS